MYHFCCYHAGYAAIFSWLEHNHSIPAGPPASTVIPQSISSIWGRYVIFPMFPNVFLSHSEVPWPSPSNVIHFLPPLWHLYYYFCPFSLFSKHWSCFSNIPGKLSLHSLCTLCCYFNLYIAELFKHPWLTPSHPLYQSNLIRKADRRSYKWPLYPPSPTPNLFFSTAPTHLMYI